MSRISHREFRTWLAWKRDQLNAPSRSDQYIMQATGHIAHVMSNERWKVSDYKLEFSEATRHSPEDAKRALARRRGEDI